MIAKKIIYLDTYIVSNIAKAQIAKDETSPWSQLYKALRKSAGAETICCPVSTIVDDEAELSKIYSEIHRISRSLSDPTTKHILDIEHAQLSRSFERFMTGASPEMETDLPISDAFNDNPHAWGPDFLIHVSKTRIEPLVEDLRARKRTKPDVLMAIYKKYETDGLTFDKIVDAESDGFGIGTLQEAGRCWKRRAENHSIDILNYGDYLPNEVELFTNFAMQNYDLNQGDALAKVAGFFRGEHCRKLPFVHIEAKLHAEIAMRTRNGYKPKPSDTIDISHISHFAPYCDILFVDSFFRDVCHSPKVRLGDTFRASIRSLSDTGQFIQELEGIDASAPQCTLAAKINKAIIDGGYPQERAAALAAKMGLK